MDARNEKDARSAKDARSDIDIGTKGTRDTQHREEMRRRFHAHKFWPVVRRRFYYLSEPELFKAMVKGKGNLRDISQWLAENIPLNERLLQYDAAQQAQLARDDRRSEAGTHNQGAHNPGAHNPGAHNPGAHSQTPRGPAGGLSDEDASPVKAPGKARQKRSAPAAEPAAVAPDTKVHLLKPKVSILEKYRARQQPKIDHLLLRSAACEDPKRRRLMRADRVAPLVISEPGAGSALLLPAARLAQKFACRDDEVPKLKQLRAGDAVAVDELDALEEKIRANRKKGQAIRVDSDADLEEEVFSDDMSEEDMDHYAAGLTSIDAQILEFLNQAPVDDLAEICNVPPQTAESIVAKRPFRSIYEVSEDKFEEDTPGPESKRKYQRKPLGLKIVERTEFSLKGYRAVDSLVKQCSEYGKLISRQMARWGVKVTGEGELDMVDVNFGCTAEGSANGDTLATADHDHSHDHDDEDDDLSATTKRGLPYVKHKPTLLAPDIELKTYQQVGINWLHLLYHNKLSCILADEMGLGKTCQVISFMAYLKSTTDKPRPHLVVVPSSTLENWLREFQKFCPEMVVQAYYGLQAEREDLRYELVDTEFDVLVTTYNLATGGASDFKFLRSQNFDMIVYDEGHMLKNSNSERYNKLMRLKAGFRLLLTGTPLQNNLKELVSLLAFMLPGLFVEKREDLQGLFNKTAMLNSSKDYNPLLSQQAINKAKTMMTPFVLRRKKAQVLKYLPEKSHQVAKCDMTPTQRDIYDEYIRQGKQTKLERERRKTLTGKAAEEAKAAPVQSSSNVMMSLRKASMHPLLFRRIYTDEKLHEMSKRIMGEPQYVDANREYIVEDMLVMSDYELNSLCEKFPKSLGSFVLEELKWLDSGKVTKLLEIIRSVIGRKEKVLVFSLFTQMLDVLEKILSFANITFVRLDGQTTVDTRQDIIDRFYEDESIPVFLLSTKAGGFGINLVAANNVVIFDQSFNPHDDKQAEDRAHRVGQTQQVLVTKLISENTIDENILMLAENKLQLDHTISNEPNDTKFEEKAASMFEKLLFDK
ncbi:hypothetical protein METBIDRAFT_40318 [Metschnikowia bicuspidata var. bicuspidata NRRL YB-4993]|uniref:DNA helicase n=1 Tax=Metschnikowia bicuspidata var. bicuspidata NRRL YB-4993 TaxID=869754 RepID=A0A1A0HDD4_9ASCO|nr:hypothetical protein METBIDRAFT_40318 [Metschnikowia bicuspidata var. bicuspidata NRRL YB-4993]OBA21985.1 hypothetical protein METBIDRAFT_40318 [Metschnikowia bicuspidata var. bicuspidata NRRL YB-4993]